MRDQVILREIVNADQKIDPETWQGGGFEHDILSAMGKHAIAFAKFLETAPKRKVDRVKKRTVHYHVFTLEEQYEIFNNQPE